ncbi:MAG: chromosome segregation protein SMC [Synergistaceae bacterium]|nr:chromosome segregation protein SMC [Synergistaceae bacterium]
MSIEFLRLKGFKSFGAACEFSFSRGLTAIVGPNGSGKSNILDALRWVLGEGGPGTLRIVRQKDLLFQGSASLDPAREAEVVLKLKDSSSSSTLRRQFTEENGSVLSADGVKIRLQDLADFKARFMLEGDSFAFIGQGEVSEAIHQRPMERRRHLELLFGIDRYRKRREDTHLKLESALAEMQRISTLISELETRRAEIAPEVAVAVEAKAILDNLENVRRDFYFSHRLDLEKKEREHRKRLQLTEEHKDLAAWWRNLWRAAVAAAEESLRREGFDESAFLERERELSARKEGLRRQSFSAATRISRLLSDRRALVAERGQISAALEVVEDDLEKAKTQEAVLRAELETKRAALEEVLRCMEEGRANAERERMRWQALQDEYAQKTLALSKLEARLKALALAWNAAEKELARLEEKRGVLIAEIGKLEAETVALEDRRERLSVEHSNAYTTFQKCAARLQQARRDLTRQKAEMEEARENASVSVYPAPTRVLLEASRQGRTASELEVVAEAFSCPAEVAPALEAYLGGRQFWLLVRALDEAREGIEILKQRSAGRATFLPLESCRPRFPDSRCRLPLSGVVGWGIELITPREPWGPALSHLMGDLLVVRDYGLGSGIVKNGAKFPIVTLEGEVFSPAGTVSGGRSRQSGGAIGCRQRVAELSAEAEVQNRRVAELESEFTRAEKQEQRAAQDQDQAEADLARLQNALSAARKSLAAANADAEQLTDEMKSEEAAAGEAELAKLHKRVSELEAELKALSPEAGGEPGSSGAAQSETDLTEEKLKGAVNVLARIRKEHGDLKERLASSEVALEAGRGEEKALREQLAALGREHLTTWREIGEVRAALEVGRDKARKAHSRLERLRARQQKAESALTTLVTESVTLGERMASIRTEVEQLQEMWEEKYPYDADEARRIEEAGRDLAVSMRRLERELKSLGACNLGALSEDESLTERIDYLTEQSEDVRAGIDELKKLIEDTDAQVETLFNQAMTDIDDRFNALFQRFFAGGEARLTLHAEGDLWNRGVEIYARPPGKRLQNISQLSGGEQSLTAIAHLFAALEVAHMPLAVLDEVDAALDEYNLIRFADLAKEYSKRLQLLVMTHRRTTMERADLIYGVTMAEAGLSKIVGIDVENYK